MQKDSPIIPIPSLINHIPRIDIYLLKIYCNIVLPLHLGFLTGLFLACLPVKIQMHFYLLSILLHSLNLILGQNIRLGVLFSNNLSLLSSLNIGEHTISKLLLTEMDLSRRSTRITNLFLFRWGGHCCPMHCDLFKIYCAPPNLGIRT